MEEFETRYRHRKALLLSGATVSWSAHSNWRRPQLVRRHAKATAKMGSAAELVFSAGDDAVAPVELAEALREMEHDSGLLMFDNQWLFRHRPVSISCAAEKCRWMIILIQMN
eukprot:SAG11_NODE_464_length_9216_cov_131.568326_10_plen_112_part_00